MDFVRRGPIHAQELQHVFPWAVTTNRSSSSPFGVDYGRITPLLAKSIQDLNLKLEDLATTTAEAANDNFTSRFFSSLFTRITAWFANAANGIGDFFAQVGNFGRVNTEELCVGATCVTEDQFRSLLNGGAAAGPQQGGEALGAAGGGSAPEEAEPAIVPDENGRGVTVSTTTTPVTGPENDIAPEVEEDPVAAEPTLELEAANDNEAAHPLPETGTQ